MNNIKRFLCFLSFAFLIAFASTSAQADDATPRPSLSRTAYSRIAPYVTPRTSLVVRVDFEALDLDKFGTTLDDLFVGALQERGFDRYSLNASNREFRKTLEIIKADYKPIEETLETFGLRELFIVAQTTDSIEHARAIIPVASSKREALSVALKALVPDVAVFELPGAICIVDDLDADKKIYSKFEPIQHDKLKRFFESTPGASLQVYCADFRIGKLLEEASLDDQIADLPEETRKGISSCDEYFRDAQIAVDLSELTFTFRSLFATAERAEDVRLGLERLADYVADRISADLIEEDDAYNLRPLQRELIRGVLREFAPEREGAALIFKADSKSKELLKNSSFIPMYAVMLVPGTKSVLTKLQYFKEKSNFTEKNASSSESAAKIETTTPTVVQENPAPEQETKAEPPKDAPPAPGKDAPPAPGKDAPPVPGKDAPPVPGKDAPIK